MKLQKLKKLQNQQNNKNKKEILFSKYFFFFTYLSGRDRSEFEELLNSLANFIVRGDEVDGEGGGVRKFKFYIAVMSTSHVKPRCKISNVRHRRGNNRELELEISSNAQLDATRNLIITDGSTLCYNHQGLTGNCNAVQGTDNAPHPRGGIC